MPTTVRLSQPPPSTNTLYRNVPRVGRVKTKAYKTWLTEMGWELKAQRPEKVCGPVNLEILVQRKRSNSDASNRIKALEDFLVTMGVIDDDKNVRKISVEWAEIVGCVVTITAVDLDAVRPQKLP